MAKTVMVSIPTRWNSVYLMLQRFAKFEEALRATIPNSTANLSIIPLEEWRCIDELFEVLKPFFEITEMMSAKKYLTGTKVLVITQGLINISDQLIQKEFYVPIKKFITILTKVSKTDLKT